MKKLVLHLGAHRCGSTAIQTLLRRENDALKQASIGVFLRADMTAGGFDLRRLHRYRHANPLWRSKLKKTARSIEAMPEQTLIVSEENIMGTMPGVRGNQFYPYFSNLVQSLAKLAELTKEPMTIAPRLVVRRQDYYLESVYAFRVSRGLTVGFDDFVNAATRTRISWLGLADAFGDVASSIRPEFALLEAWPKATAAALALDFLIGENVLELSQTRLTGNTRRTVQELTFMLAMSRAHIHWRDTAWHSQIKIDDNEQMLDVVKQNVSAEEFQNFGAHYVAPSKFGFDDAERASFVQSYRAENEQFLALPIVEGTLTDWRDS